MNRSILNIVLLVVLGGLGAAVYLSQKKEEKGPPLTALTPAAVTLVVIEQPKAPAIRLEKQNGSWRLTQPVQADADAFELNALLGLSDQELQSTLDPAKVQPKELGLEPPAYKVTLNDQLLEFGGEEPLKYRRYVRHGDKIGLISDPSPQAVDADYSDLVAKALVPTGADIVGINGPGFVVEKKPDGSWASPEHPEAKSETLQRYVDSWKNANSMWNAQPPSSAPGGGEVVRLSFADGRNRMLVVVAKDPQLQLVDPGLKVQFTLSKAQADELLKLPGEAKPEPKPEAPPAPAEAPTPAP